MSKETVKGDIHYVNQMKSSLPQDIILEAEKHVASYRPKGLPEHFQPTMHIEIKQPGSDKTLFLPDGAQIPQGTKVIRVIEENQQVGGRFKGLKRGWYRHIHSHKGSFLFRGLPVNIEPEI